jgi:hypothetical protein
MANIIHINRMTATTLRIPLTDSSRAVTINLMDRFYDMNLNGRKVLKSFNILTDDKLIVEDEAIDYR